jgi:hypothetical protein
MIPRCSALFYQIKPWNVLVFLQLGTTMNSWLPLWYCEITCRDRALMRAGTGSSQLCQVDVDVMDSIGLQIAGCRWLLWKTPSSRPGSFLLQYLKAVETLQHVRTCYIHVTNISAAADSRMLKSDQTSWCTVPVPHWNHRFSSFSSVLN